MPSRRLEDLHPELQPLARQFLDQCTAAGLRILITCTYRSPAEQAELYASGRTKPGPVVTKAKPGQSAHNFQVKGLPAARAFDIVPLDAKGKAIWDAANPAWKTAGAIATGLGLDWGGTWKFKDLPHIQLPR